ncbi:CRISPR-associated RAMP Cmr3 [hydrothermal vent metagenome]|uniref:CRISPR-associated RAMP Cmr3 n=1 Tax=hydrothermal vent metagenome TaxID=652676 RepID=A0A1W1BEI6_9ZZZZ
MSYTYLVTLQPQDDFFFGGEYTFAKDDTRQNEGSRYSALSTYFPQQSALLGMLRKTLLVQNGNLTLHLRGEWVDSGKKGQHNPNYEEAVRLVGKDSFSYEQEGDFGIIEAISPLFLKRGETSYIVDAKDKNYSPKRNTDIKMSLNGKVGVSLFMENFNPKEYSDEQLIGTDGSTISITEIFEEVQSVGIKKSHSSQTKEDSLFQKRGYKLKDKALFAFYLTLKEPLKWKKAYVTLGADRSSFMMRLHQTKESFNSTFAKLFEPKDLDRIVLHSETLVDKESYNKALFIYGKRKSYRYLKDKNASRSKRYYLFERGSVIYTNDLEALSANLAKEHLQKVGINHFTSIKGKANV